MADLVTVLKKMTCHSDFRSFLNEPLRDRLVCGLANENIYYTKHLSEDKLTFDKAVSIAIAMEATAKDTRKLSKRSPVV